MNNDIFSYDLSLKEAIEQLCKMCVSNRGCNCGLKRHFLCDYIRRRYGEEAEEHAKTIYCARHGISYPDELKNHEEEGEAFYFRGSMFPIRRAASTAHTLRHHGRAPLQRPLRRPIDP